jgi:hypothetical protein
MQPDVIAVDGQQHLIWRRTCCHCCWLCVGVDSLRACGACAVQLYVRACLGRAAAAERVALRPGMAVHAMN